MTGPTPLAPELEVPRGLWVSVETIAWVATAAVFVLLRLGPVWQAPVGGPELVHLSGAWQAREGISDGRFAPTLFQAISAAILHWSSSEVPSRAIAFLATATTPGAIYLLRPRLGKAGALLALAFMAFDGPQIALGTGASAMGLDLAVTMWLFVAFCRPGFPPAVWCIAGFAVASAGPVSLPLVVAGAVLVAARRVRLPADGRMGFAAIGTLLGVVATTARFGLGVDGLRLAPIDLFALGFEERWSTSTAADVVMLYSWPVVGAGAVAGVTGTIAAYRRRSFDPAMLLQLIWAGVALLWWLASLTSHSAVPAAALSLPLALLLGPAAPRAIEAMAGIPRAGWRVAGVLLAVAACLVLIGVMNVLKWADAGEVRDNQEAALVTGFFIMAAATLGYLALDRRMAPSLVLVGLAGGVALMVAGGTGVAFSGREEPIVSPRIAPQASTLRVLAIESAATSGGMVGIHPLVAADATWVFRESGAIITARPDDAAVLVWPLDLPQPQGWAPLEGKWALVESVSPPTAELLDHVAWLAGRNRLDVVQAPVNVFVRAKQ